MAYRQPATTFARHAPLSPPDVRAKTKGAVPPGPFPGYWAPDHARLIASQPRTPVREPRVSAADQKALQLEEEARERRQEIAAAAKMSKKELRGWFRAQVLDEESNNSDLSGED